MIQRFIELGEGYSDLYELLEVTQAMSTRVERLPSISSEINGSKKMSLAVVMSPTDRGDFQPIYISREGIPADRPKNSRFDLFQKMADELGKPIVQLEVKPSVDFSEKELYYQYLIGVLRLNHLIPPLQ